jgi:hypothetical protein
MKVLSFLWKNEVAQFVQELKSGIINVLTRGDMSRLARER